MPPHAFPIALLSTHRARISAPHVVHNVLEPMQTLPYTLTGTLWLPSELVMCWCRTVLSESIGLPAAVGR